MLNFPKYTCFYIFFIQETKYEHYLNPPPTIFVSLIESYVKSGKLETTLRLLEIHVAAGQIDLAMKLYNSMTNAGLKPDLMTKVHLILYTPNLAHLCRCQCIVYIIRLIDANIRKKIINVQ